MGDMNWLIPITIWTSLSFRTPNVPAPVDYEVAMGFEKADIVYADIEYERERGEEFIDQEYWIAKKGKHWLSREKYVNLSSHGINYNQADVRFVYDDFNVGYALRHVDDIPSHRLVAGYSVDKRFNILLSSGQLTSAVELDTNFDGIGYSYYGKVAFDLMTNLAMYGLYKTERVGDNKYLQLKIGIEVNIPEA